MTSQGDLHEKLKLASGHKGQRTVQKKESESWDEDFLFQRSASDLHLPLSGSPSPNSKASRSTPKQSKAFLHGPYTNARQAASTLSFGSDSENEPTLTQATISARAKGKASAASSASQRDATITMPRQSKQRLPIHGSRNASHSSNYSTGSSVSPHDWRSPTPSLTSDMGGLTTSTETEVDTESWDDVDQYCSTTEAETEVECGPAEDMDGSFSKGPTDPSAKRKSGLRMPSIPSIFKNAKRRSLIRNSSSQQETPQSRWADDRDLPSELRAVKNAAATDAIGTAKKSKRSSTISVKYNPEENVTIVPLRSKQRSRVESANGSISTTSTPPRGPRSTPSTASMDRRILDSPSSSYIESPNSSKDVYMLRGNPNAVSSDVSFLSDSAEDSDGRSSFASKKSNKRKIKKKSRVPSIAIPTPAASDPSSIAREPSPALSPIRTSFSQSPAQPSGSSPTPRRRPLSFSMMMPNRSPSLSSRPVMQQTQSDLAPARPPASGWKKFHRPSSSIGSLPSVQSLANTALPLQPPTQTTGSGLLARARAFSRSRSPPPPVPPLPSVHVSHQQSFPSMPKSDSVASTLSMQSTASTIRPSSSIPKSPFLHTFDSPSHSVHSDINTIAESAEPATPVKGKTIRHSTSPKHDLPPLNLPPIQFVTKAGSNEQLSVRTPSRLAPNGHVVSKSSPFPSPPGSLKRPLTANATRPNANSYFTIGTASSQSGSPGRDLVMAPISGRNSSVTRRVSLSDLRIPSRITNAQARIGQDLKRVKEFKAGVEELKELRNTYSSLISGATAHLFNTSFDTTQEDSKRIPAPPAAASAKLEQSVKRMEAQYAVHWECCDVLIDLADGTEEDAPGATTARRERCISMMPTTNGSPDRSARRQNASMANSPLTDEALLSPQFRQMELLQGMLGQTMSRTSEHNLKSQQPAVPSPAVVDTKISKPAPQASSKANIFGIRDYLRALKKEAIGPSKIATLSPPTNVDERRTVSDPLRSSASGSSAPTSCSAFDSDDEEEEDWDRSSDSSDEAMATPLKLNMSRSRTMSVTTTTTSNAATPPWPMNSKLALTTEAMPSLLAYLTEVKERCTSCLSELRGITV